MYTICINLSEPVKTTDHFSFVPGLVISANKNIKSFTNIFLVENDREKQHWKRANRVSTIYVRHLMIFTMAKRKRWKSLDDDYNQMALIKKKKLYWQLILKKDGKKERKLHSTMRATRAPVSRSAISSSKLRWEVNVWVGVKLGESTDFGKSKTFHEPSKIRKLVSGFILQNHNF